jgi:hypothetical protein
MHPEKPTLQRSIPERGQRYEIFKLPEERKFLLLVADNFIDQIREIHQKNPYDAFVFFDRGARLFGHLIRERWKHRFPEDKIPPIFFVKIGREMGVPSPDPDQPIGYIYPWKNIFEREFEDDPLPSISEIIERIKDNLWFKRLVRNLRKAFTKRGKAIFDGKRILLVDEFMASGSTLRYGKELFRRVFKNIAVDGAALTSRFSRYTDNPSIIMPVSGDLIVRTLGDPNFAGIRTPSPPSREYKDKFFIEPIYLSPLKRKIMEIEREIEQLEERVKRIPKHKRVKEKENYWGVDYVAHPLIEKLENLQEELKEERKRYEKIEKDWERYRQARREIHLIATSN